MIALEAGGVDGERVALVDAHLDRVAAVVAADVHAGGGGDPGFQLDPPPDLAGLVVLSFNSHRLNGLGLPFEPLHRGAWCRAVLITILR